MNKKLKLKSKTKMGQELYYNVQKNKTVFHSASQVTIGKIKKIPRQTHF